MNPDVAHVLQYFRTAHLRDDLAHIAEPFQELAFNLSVELDGPELTVALRKLLESKDAAVRAALAKES